MRLGTFPEKVRVRNLVRAGVSAVMGVLERGEGQGAGLVKALGIAPSRAERRQSTGKLQPFTGGGSGAS